MLKAFALLLGFVASPRLFALALCRPREGSDHLHIVASSCSPAWPTIPVPILTSCGASSSVGCWPTIRSSPVRFLGQYATKLHHRGRHGGCNAGRAG